MDEWSLFEDDGDGWREIARRRNWIAGRKEDRVIAGLFFVAVGSRRVSHRFVVKVGILNRRSFDSRWSLRMTRFVFEASAEFAGTKKEECDESE